MIITKAPFRISLFGGGSDLADYYSQSPAAVLSTTIDKYMYISSHRYFDHDKITAKYSQTELVTGADQIKHPIIREVLRQFGVDGGIEVASIADIPSGTGLGSSSAFTVALLHNLHARQGRYATKEMLAAGACGIEIDTLRHPDVLGTIAGDDTVIVIPRSIAKTTALARRLRELANLE